jgi:type I restriction enzyme, S subunit
MSKWPLCEIADVFDVARGGSPRPIQSYLTNSPQGLNWIMIGDASEGSKYITATKNRIKPEGLKKTRMVREGDFLLTNSMSFGRPYILKTSGCIHDGWLVLSPKDDRVFPDFFYYLLGSKTLFNEFSKRAAGAVVKNLNTSIVKSVQVPLPPLPEQKHIAAILDAADALRAKRRECLAQLDALTQSTFLDMFGDPVTNPKGWGIVPLKEILAEKPVSGAYYPKSAYSNTGTSMVHMANAFYGIVELKGIRRVNAKACEVNKYGLRSSDILVARRSLNYEGSAKPCLIPDSKEPLIFESSLIRLRPNLEKILTIYLFHYLQNDLVRLNYVFPLVTRSTISGISQSNLMQVKVIAPPLSLQRRFATIVESVEKQKTRMRAHLAELDTLFASLQSRAFNGEL